jgi:ribosomal-protein-alanine N-acetyltransferase
MTELTTPRLRLVPADAALIAADRSRLEPRETRRGEPSAGAVQSDDPLGRLLRARVPANWPPSLIPDALPIWQEKLEEEPNAVGWLTWYWVACRWGGGEDELIGGGGFKGPPDASGAVEIGYSVLSQFRGKGFASEAVAALLAWAIAQPHVHLIIAETFPQLQGSVRLLGKLGFRKCGAGAEPGSVRFELRPGELPRR